MNAKRLIAAALLASACGTAFAAGPPPPSYPERYEAPTTTAERDERCTTYAERVETTGGWLKAEGFMGRLDFVRNHHRRMERFLKEYCGQATEQSLALSHRAEPRSGRPDIHHPDRTLQAAPGPVSHGGPEGYEAGHH